jgi:hypothetical protein
LVFVGSVSDSTDPENNKKINFQQKDYAELVTNAILNFSYLVEIKRFYCIFKRFIVKTIR